MDFSEAAQKYLKENQHKKSVSDDEIAFGNACPRFLEMDPPGFG